MTLYNPEYCQQLILEMAGGKLDVEIYSKWSVCKKTFHNWKNDHEEFNEAHQVGLAKCEAWWIGKMKEAWLRGDEKGFKYCISIMNNKFGWGKDENKASTVNNIQINSVAYNNKSETELLGILKRKFKDMNLLDKLEDIQPDILTLELKDAVRS